jgi:hypothetical protein
LGPLRVYIPLTTSRRRRRRVKKPRKPIGRVGLVFCVVFGAGFAFFEHIRPHETMPVSRATYTAAQPWPLTVDSGVLSCKNGDVLFTTGGITYTQDPRPGDGYSDIKLITAPQSPLFPEQKMPVYLLMSEGEHLC